MCKSAKNVCLPGCHWKDHLESADIVQYPLICTWVVDGNEVSQLPTTDIQTDFAASLYKTQDERKILGKAIFYLSN